MLLIVSHSQALLVPSLSAAIILGCHILYWYTSEERLAKSAEQLDVMLEYDIGVVICGRSFILHMIARKHSKIIHSLHKASLPIQHRTNSDYNIIPWAIISAGIKNILHIAIPSKFSSLHEA